MNRNSNKPGSWSQHSGPTFCKLSCSHNRRVASEKPASAAAAGMCGVVLPPQDLASLPLTRRNGSIGDTAPQTNDTTQRLKSRSSLGRSQQAGTAGDLVGRHQGYTSACSSAIQQVERGREERGLLAYGLPMTGRRACVDNLEALRMDKSSGIL